MLWVMNHMNPFFGGYGFVSQQNWSKKEQKRAWYGYGLFKLVPPGGIMIPNVPQRQSSARDHSSWDTWPTSSPFSTAVALLFSNNHQLYSVGNSSSLSATSLSMMLQWERTPPSKKCSYFMLFHVFGQSYSCADRTEEVDFTIVLPDFSICGACFTT